MDFGLKRDAICLEKHKKTRKSNLKKEEKCTKNSIPPFQQPPPIAPTHTKKQGKTHFPMQKEAKRSIFPCLFHNAKKRATTYCSNDLIVLQQTLHTNISIM